MGTNEQGYHLLWPDLPTFSENQFTARPTPSVLCCLRLRPKTVAYFVQVLPGALRQHSLRLLLAGFSIIQSTTNRMKPLRISFDENPCSALARRY